MLCHKADVVLYAETPLVAFLGLAHLGIVFPLISLVFATQSRLFPLYCKQDIFIFYIQWLIFLLIGNTMKNTMLRKGLTIF